MTKTCNEDMKVVKNDVRHIEKSIDDIQQTLRDHEKIFVMLVQFMPVRNAVYGFIAVFMTGLLGALITLVLK